MQKILFLFLIVLFYGCGPTKAELDAATAKAVADAITKDSTVVFSNPDEKSITIHRVTQIMKPDGRGGGSLRFLTINGHDYIQWYGGDIASMCHDENCGNEIHPKPTL